MKSAGLPQLPLWIVLKRDMYSVIIADSFRQDDLAADAFTHMSTGELLQFPYQFICGFQAQEFAGS